MPSRISEFQGPDTFGDDLPDTFGDDLSVSEIETLEGSLEPEFVDDLEEELQKGKDLDLYANLEMCVLDVDLAPCHPDPERGDARAKFLRHGHRSR